MGQLRCTTHVNRLGVNFAMTSSTSIGMDVDTDFHIEFDSDSQALDSINSN